jgi:hypothetical protein
MRNYAFCLTAMVGISDYTARNGAALSWAEKIPYGALTVEIFFMLCLLAGAFLLKTRLLKIVSGCGAELCLWLACKAAFGPDAIPSQILTWITAGVVIVLTMVVITRIPWHKYGDKKNGQDR